MHVFDEGPANHDCIVASGSWSDPIKYSTSPNTYWLSSNRDIVAQNRFVVELERAANPDPKQGQIGLDATHAMIRIKLKTNIPATGAGLGYAQADCYQVLAGQTSNHFIHVEEWGREQGNTGAGRRIAYATIFAPIVSDQVILDVTRGIVGRGSVEFAAYLEGYI